MIKFTNDENTFIDFCYHSTRVYYIDDPKKRDNDEDIRIVINYVHDHVGSIGPDNHIHLHSIFKKLGYCKDGKTTLEQERLDLAMKEQEKDKQWIINRNKAFDKIRKKRAALDLLEKELIESDEKFIERSKENKKIVLASLEKKQKIEKELAQEKLIKSTNKAISEMTVPELRSVAKDKGLTNYSKMRKAELQKAVSGL